METRPDKSPIKFHYQVTRFNLPHRRALKSFIGSIFRLEKVRLESLSCIFCTDEYLLEINKAYLSHDYYTDIITFNLGNEGSIEGELYISIDRVRENAIELGVSFQQELLRVIFHGVLHLCGYEDSSGSQKQAMRLAEDKYLKLYDVR